MASLSTPSGTKCSNSPEREKTLRYRERCASKGQAYLRQLRHIVQRHGMARVVYVDESGFAPTTYRPHAWAPRRGQLIYGERSGHRHPRTTLIATKRGAQFVAPLLFDGYTNARWFTQCLVEHLFPLLPPRCTLVLDNAAFHKTTATQQTVAAAQHTLLFLPPYSPDFNPIEQDFAILKKHRQFAPPDTSLDDLVIACESYSK